MQYKSIQKASLALCVLSAIGIIGTFGGYGDGYLIGGSFALILLLFTLLLVSNVFIVRLAGEIRRLKRCFRRMEQKESA